MSRIILISAWLLGTLPALATDANGFAPAAILAIQSEFPGVSPYEVQLLGTPTPNEKFRGVIVRKANFDTALRQWQLQLECVPNKTCVPAVAIVRSPDKNLLPAKSRLPLLDRQEVRVRSGDFRQISTQIGQIRLQRSVVCLQSGTAGDRIRVRELSGKKVLLAEVQPDGSLALRRTP